MSQQSSGRSSGRPRKTLPEDPEDSSGRPRKTGGRPRKTLPEDPGRLFRKTSEDLGRLLEGAGRLFRKTRKTLLEDHGRLFRKTSEDWWKTPEDSSRRPRKTLPEDWKNLPGDTEDPASGKGIKGDEQSQSWFWRRLV